MTTSMANTTFCFPQYSISLEPIHFENFVIKNFMFGLSDYLRTIALQGFVFLFHIWITIIVLLLSVVINKMNRVAKFLGSKEDRPKTNGLTQQKKPKWTSMFHISNKDKVSQLSSHTKKLSISNPKLYSVDHATVLKNPSLPKGTKDTNFKQIYEEPSKYLMPTLEQDDGTNNKENLPSSEPKSKTNIVMGIKASNQTRRIAPGFVTRATSDEIKPQISSKPSTDCMNNLKFQTPAPYVRKDFKSFQKDDQNLLPKEETNDNNIQPKSHNKAETDHFVPPIAKTRLSLLKRHTQSNFELKAVGQEIRVKKPMPRPRTLKRYDIKNTVTSVAKEPCHLNSIGGSLVNNAYDRHVQEPESFSITDLVNPSSNVMWRILE